jgi:hypothetical protein
MPVKYICDRCENEVFIESFVKFSENGKRDLTFIFCPKCKADLKKFVETKITRTVVSESL